MSGTPSSNRPVRYPDSEEGVRGVIADVTAYSVGNIIAMDRHPSMEGCWVVTFRSRRILAYVGEHPFAPDFKLLKYGDVPGRA